MTDVADGRQAQYAQLARWIEQARIRSMLVEILPRLLTVKGGVILYDGAQRGKVHEHVFSLAYWRAHDALGDPLGGRGAAWRIQADGIDWVLRLYRRGGLPGRFIDDTYLHTGLER